MGVGVGVGVEGTLEPSLDCPHVTVAAKKMIDTRAGLQFPIRVNSFFQLKSPDNAHGNGGPGKQ